MMTSLGVFLQMYCKINLIAVLHMAHSSKNYIYIHTVYGFILILCIIVFHAEYVAV